MWSVLAHGDFAKTLATLDGPIAMARIPRGRSIFFLNDPNLVSEATLSKATSLRDRQDEHSSGDGVVDACGADWTRRRQGLRVLQTQTEALSKPAVADALEVCSCPPYTLMLPPPDVLECANALVRHALNAIAISVQPGGLLNNLPAASTSNRHSRGFGAAVGTALLAPLARLLRGFLRLGAWVTLYYEQASGIFRGSSFFNLALLFTSRKRKLERRVSQWSAALKSSQFYTRVGGSVANAGRGTDWVEAVVTARSAGSAAPVASRPDLLSHLIEADSGLTRQEVVDVLKDVLTAGGDTTASSLATAILLLQRYPSAAARVAREGRDAEIAAAAQGATADSSELAFAKAVLQEATRLYPPAPLLLRVALTDTTLGGHVIPAGSGLVASTERLGRDPTAWGPDPDAFCPERFLPGHPSFRPPEAGRAYMAFGAGPRSCVGQQLALSVASQLLARLAADALSEGLLENDAHLERDA